MSFFEFPNTRTYDSDLGWLIRHMHDLLEWANGMTEWRSEHEEQYRELKKLYDDAMAGILPDNLQAALEVWIKRNAGEILQTLVAVVFFGLTDSGYFVAYVPESWQEITFNTTDYDITVDMMPEFGHLVLSY